MFGQLFTIARNTFLEAVRQPIFFSLTVAGCLLQVLNLMLSTYSMGFSEEGLEVDKDNKLLLDIGLATVLATATLLAAFVATGVLSREIERKTALTVISKPVGRPVFVVGKYLGAAGAILLSSVAMLAFLQLALRHGVMSTARDTLDIPVLLFGGLALVIPIAIGAWGNYFYNWVFSSTASFLIAPMTVLAYFVTLFVSKEWSFVDGSEYFRPQILIASGLVLLAMGVLTAVAVAASTRLGQVMTLLVCAAVFVLGLLSNYLLGQYAYQNRVLGQVEAVEFELDANLRSGGDTGKIRLESQPSRDIQPGDAVYYGPAVSGVGLVVPRQEAFTGDLQNATDLIDPSMGRGLVATGYDAEERLISIVNTGGLRVERLPVEGDFVFGSPTRVQPVALAAWSVVPNFQSFWVVDAISQGHPIPPGYILLVIGYAIAQIVGLVSLAVFLFQARDVG